MTKKVMIQTKNELNARGFLKYINYVLAPLSYSLPKINYDRANEYIDVFEKIGMFRPVKEGKVYYFEGYDCLSFRGKWIMFVLNKNPKISNKKLKNLLEI